MIKLFESLRAAEKNLDTANRQLRETGEELLAERKHNRQLAKHLDAANNRLRAAERELATYQVGFWSLCGIGALTFIIVFWS